MMIGSMGFMAPEQISGHPGPEADIFAWGVTVAYAAGGRSPFGAGSTHSVLYRIMYGDADIASVPDSLLPLVEASLAKDPQSRPSARQLLDRLTSGSGPSGSADDTTQVILARTWQSGSHASPPPAGGPPGAGQVPPRQPAAPDPWPHVARAAASAPATVPPVTVPPVTAPPVTAPPAAAAPAADTPTADTPTTDSPIPVLPIAAVPSSAVPSAAVPSTATPGPATPAPDKVPVGRRMATIATSALVAMRLRRPGRPDEPKS
jgi:serine/threonine protein kinase